MWIIFVALSCFVTSAFGDKCNAIYVRWPRVKVMFGPRAEGEYSLTTCKSACTNDEDPLRSAQQLQCSGFNHRQGMNDIGQDCQLYQADQLQHVDGFVEAHDQYSFYWKYCVNSGKTCSGDYAFTFLSDRYMDAREVTRVTYTSSLEDCLSACLDEASFACRSASFNRTDGGCHLSQQNQLSKPSLLRINNNPNFRIDYYENNCFNLTDSFTFDYQCKEDGILVEVNSKYPYTGALYGLYDFFTCRIEPKNEKHIEFFFPSTAVSTNCSDSIRYKGNDMVLEVVLSTDGVEPLYFITPDDLTYQARCPIRENKRLNSNQEPVPNLESGPNDKAAFSASARALFTALSNNSLHPTLHSNPVKFMIPKQSSKSEPSGYTMSSSQPTSTFKSTTKDTFSLHLQFAPTSTAVTTSEPTVRPQNTTLPESSTSSQSTSAETENPTTASEPVSESTTSQATEQTTVRENETQTTTSELTTTTNTTESPSESMTSTTELPPTMSTQESITSEATSESASTESTSQSTTSELNSTISSTVSESTKTSSSTESESTTTSSSTVAESTSTSDASDSTPTSVPFTASTESSEQASSSTPVQSESTAPSSTFVTTIENEGFSSTSETLTSEVISSTTASEASLTTESSESATQSSPSESTLQTTIEPSSPVTSESTTESINDTSTASSHASDSDSHSTVSASTSHAESTSESTTSTLELTTTSNDDSTGFTMTHPSSDRDSVTHSTENGLSPDISTKPAIALPSSETPRGQLTTESTEVTSIDATSQSTSESTEDSTSATATSDAPTDSENQQTTRESDETSVEATSQSTTDSTEKKEIEEMSTTTSVSTSDETSTSTDNSESAQSTVTSSPSPTTEIIEFTTRIKFTDVLSPTNTASPKPSPSSTTKDIFTLPYVPTEPSTSSTMTTEEVTSSTSTMPTSTLPKPTTPSSTTERVVTVEAVSTSTAQTTPESVETATTSSDAPQTTIDSLVTSTQTETTSTKDFSSSSSTMQPSEASTLKSGTEAEGQQSVIPKKAVTFDVFHNGQPVEAVVVGSRITLSFTPFYAIPPKYMSITGCQVEPIDSIYEWEREPLAIIKDGCQADHVGLVCPPQRTDYGVRVTVESFRYQSTPQIQYTCLVRICPFAPCPVMACPSVDGCTSNDLITRTLGLRAKRHLTIDEIRAALAANPDLQRQIRLTSHLGADGRSSAETQHQLIALGGDHIVKKRLVVMNSEDQLRYYLRTGDVPNRR